MKTPVNHTDDKSSYSFLNKCLIRGLGVNTELLCIKSLDYNSAITMIVWVINKQNMVTTNKNKIFLTLLSFYI